MKLCKAQLHEAHHFPATPLIIERKANTHFSEQAKQTSRKPLDFMNTINFMNTIKFNTINTNSQPNNNNFTKNVL